MKFVWIVICIALAAAGLCAPMMAEKLLASQTISQPMANVMGMVGIPIGFCGIIILFCLLFM